jgi:putative heme-binding domain-containing protein
MLFDPKVARETQQPLYSMRRREMDRRHSWYRIVFLGSMALATVVPANAQSLPAGDGKADFQRICSGCHSVDRATSQRMTRPEWAGVVSDMVGRGAQGSSAELDNVVSYLSANFGKGSPSPSPVAPQGPSVVARQAEKLIPLPAEEVSKVQKLIQENGCLSCHRLDGMGSYAGPYLDGIGAHRSSEQLRAALISPKKEVLPENRSVRFVTREGKTVTGKLLNQDGFNVQLIDASGRLASYERAGLREFAILTTNPMPSYSEKMSAQELSDLVRYLNSLKGGVAQ